MWVWTGLTIDPQLSGRRRWARRLPCKWRHKSPRTTNLYDRIKERLTQDEVEGYKGLSPVYPASANLSRSSESHAGCLSNSL